MEEMKICSTACKLFIHLFISLRNRGENWRRWQGRWRRISIVLVLSVQHYKLACCSSYVDIWIHLCMEEYDSTISVSIPYSLENKFFTQWFRYGYTCWQKICRHLVIKLFSCDSISMGEETTFFLQILVKYKIRKLKKKNDQQFFSSRVLCSLFCMKIWWHCLLNIMEQYGRTL
jgi:hypothetical protein